MKIVVTGANGFIGRELVDRLVLNQDSIRILVRRPAGHLPKPVDRVIVSDLADVGNEHALAEALSGNDAVVHLAAITPGALSGDQAAVSARDTELTVKLARLAAAAGIRKFIYLSSALVFGGSSIIPFSEESPAVPRDYYARSKLACEAGLRAAAEASGMQWTIIRPPLVYGPGVKGSLRTLARTVARGVPLPLGSVSCNRRDMIGVRNLASFIERALTNAAAANDTFVVRDGEAVSSRELIEMISEAAGRPARLFRIDTNVLRYSGKLLRLHGPIESLTENFEIDDSKARRQLGWIAEKPLGYDIKRMVAAL
jgi:nucleoside-diphosphate-sugar epimerase